VAIQEDPGLMRILQLDQLPADIGPSVVTIGKYDGVHLGHRGLVDQVLAIAAERGLASVIITFDRNPLAVLRPQACPDDLVSLDQKLELLGDTGVDAVVVARFDGEFASRSPEEFVREVLVDGVQARVVLVGPDFRFGAKGAGDVDLLRELGAGLGFEVVALDQITDASGERISSTRVRERLAEGDIHGAADLLGRLPRIRSVVVKGQQRGRTLGYPTANLAPEIEGYLPADGVYAAWLLVDGQPYGAAVSIGNNPTFEGVPDKQVEAHALDQSFDLYGRVVEIEFVEFIRGMRKFSGADALAGQMQADEEQIRAVLGVPRP
jgi:riboflavin kinase/FMN adenylyltransferase